MIAAMRDYYTRYPRTILWLVPEGEWGLDGESPQIISPFYLSKSPITNEQFEAFDPSFQRSAVSPGDKAPATGLSIDQAREYVAWYAKVSRKPMRLPTALEWAYASGGGPEDLGSPEARDLDELAWHRDNSGGLLPPLEQKKANGFGFFGMLGGVWEWSEGESGPILHGGSFRTDPAEISPHLRRPGIFEGDLSDVGFRIARSLRP